MRKYREKILKIYPKKDTFYENLPITKRGITGYLHRTFFSAIVLNRLGIIDEIERDLILRNINEIIPLMGYKKIQKNDYSVENVLKNAQISCKSIFKNTVNNHINGED